VWAWLAFTVRIPANRMPFIAAWSGGAMLGVIALVQSGSSAAAWVATGIGGSLVFLALTGGQRATAPASVRVGDRLPSFTASDEHGQPFDIRSLAGSPLLLKFFRGHW
jgi:cytochrome oxidase Cu insertion factor (SCO1/SenC/PrrC family)